MTDLPAGWHTESLSEVAKGGLFSDGDWVESKDQDPAGGVRLTQLADVGVAAFRDRSDRWLREDQASRLGCTFLQPDDILVARMPDPLGRACLVPPSIGRAVTVVDVAILRPTRSDVDRRYLMWAINAPQVSAQVESMQSGTTRRRISRKNLGTVAIPVPELDDQRRIVDILEDHLSRLDAANSYLDASRRRLEKLEQVTLQRLTTTGAEHLLGEISTIQGGIQKQAKRRPVQNSFPFLRVANVTSAGLDLAEVHRIELFAGELARYRLLVGDLLVVEGNGSPSQIGRAAIWDGSIKDCVHQNHLIRVRPAPGLLPEYLEAAWNAVGSRRALTALASSTSGLYTLSVSKLQKLTIRAPAPEVQARVAAEVRSIREARSALDKAVADGVQRSGALRRSLLAAAFQGRLTGHSSDLDLAEEMAGT